jgi:hypothetical protein
VPVVRSIEKLGDDEVPVLIEVDEIPSKGRDDVYGAARGGKHEKVLDAAGGLFHEALDLSRTCAEDMVRTMEAAGEKIKPDEFQVQLAIKLDAEVGAVIAKSSAGAQLQVSMTWRRA